MQVPVTLVGTVPKGRQVAHAQGRALLVTRVRLGPHPPPRSSALRDSSRRQGLHRVHRATWVRTVHLTARQLLHARGFVQQVGDPWWWLHWWQWLHSCRVVVSHQTRMHGRCALSSCQWRSCDCRCGLWNTPLMPAGRYGSTGGLSSSQCTGTFKAYAPATASLNACMRARAGFMSRAAASEIPVLTPVPHWQCRSL
jgi:hypothetical protein